MKYIGISRKIKKTLEIVLIIHYFMRGKYYLVVEEDNKKAKLKTTFLLIYKKMPSFGSVRRKITKKCMK